MGGIFDSIFDNPRRYRWEPDAQEVPKDIKVIKQESELWPDGDHYRYQLMNPEEVRLAEEIAKKLKKIQKQRSYKEQYDKLIQVRDEVKKRLQKKEEEYAKLTQSHITEIKKEIAEYKKESVRIQGKIYLIKNYTITIKNLRDLVAEIPATGDDNIIQISDEHNENYWRNCRFTMLRVLMSASVARGLVPRDDNAVIDP